MKSLRSLIVALAAVVLMAIPATGFAQHGGGSRHRVRRAADAGVATALVETTVQPLLVPAAAPSTGGDTHTQEAAAPLPAVQPRDTRSLLNACFERCIGGNEGMRTAVCGRAIDVPANADRCLNNASIAECVTARGAIQGDSSIYAAAFCDGMSAAAVARAASQRAEVARRRAAAERTCSVETTSERFRAACRRCILASQAWIQGPEGLEIVKNATGYEAPTEEQEVRFRCQAARALPIYGAIQRLVTGLAGVRTEQTAFHTRLATTGLPLDAPSARLLATQAEALEQLRARSDLFEVEMRLRECRMNHSSSANAQAPREASVHEEVRVVIPSSNTNWLRMPFIPASREPSHRAPPATVQAPVNPCADLEENLSQLRARYDARFATRATRPLLRMGMLQEALGRVARACEQQLLTEPSGQAECAAARSLLANWESMPEPGASPDPVPVAPVAPVIAPTAPTPPAPPVAREPVVPTDESPPALPAP